MNIPSLISRIKRKTARQLCELPGQLGRRFAQIMARRLARRCRVLHDPSRDDALTVLVFSAERFRQDLEALAQSQAVKLIEIPGTALGPLNALYRTIPEGIDSDRYDYFLETDETCLAERKRQIRFFQGLVAELVKILPIDCAITPAVHYRGEHAWAAAFEAAGVPFVALHKEFTVIDERHLPERIELYRKRNFRFPGSWVLVTNRSAQRLFAEGGVMPEDRITVTGLPRMDRLFRSDGPFRRKHGFGKQVTLFSFAHYCGGLGITRPRRAKLFSANDDEGFVELYRAVHGAIGELAIAHPDVSFKIKPKALADWWIGEIDTVLKQEVGKGLDDLPNCEIGRDTAPELIRESDVVIGFNSTVLLESLAIGRPTIMPYFAEATETYPHYVYLRDYVDAFAPARTRADLKSKIELALEGRLLNDELPAAEREACFRFYLGYADSRSSERVVNALRQIVARYKGVTTSQESCETSPAEVEAA